MGLFNSIKKWRRNKTIRQLGSGKSGPAPTDPPQEEIDHIDQDILDYYYHYEGEVSEMELRSYTGLTSSELHKRLRKLRRLGLK